MNFSDQAVREFLEAYLVSNTPLYFYKRLRNMAAIQDLAQAVPSKEITDEYLNRSNMPTPSPKDVVIAYACLVALTHKNTSEAFPLLRSLDLSKLKWAPIIRELYFAKTSSGDTHNIIITDPKIPSVRSWTDASSTLVKKNNDMLTIQTRPNL